MGTAFYSRFSSFQICTSSSRSPILWTDHAKSILFLYVLLLPLDAYLLKKNTLFLVFLYFSKDIQSTIELKESIITHPTVHHDETIPVTSARWANILGEKIISKIYFWQKKSNSPDRGCDIEAKFFGKKNFFILILFCSFLFRSSSKSFLFSIIQ